MKGSFCKLELKEKLQTNYSYPVVSSVLVFVFSFSLSLRELRDHLFGQIKSKANFCWIFIPKHLSLTQL